MSSKQDREIAVVVALNTGGRQRWWHRASLGEMTLHSRHDLSLVLDKW
ncbi:hypothetical protein [Nocardia abscessus]|nr:hypothetical protein [Nocardia abscessus]MCC3331558.1 hypothetical protein [Nocardia abscessus]